MKTMLTSFLILTLCVPAVTAIEKVDLFEAGKDGDALYRTSLLTVARVTEDWVREDDKVASLPGNVIVDALQILPAELAREERAGKRPSGYAAIEMVKRVAPAPVANPPVVNVPRKPLKPDPPRAAEDSSPATTQISTSH